MDKLFSDVKKYIKRPEVIIDNYAFRLHYGASLTLVLAASILVTARQFFGDPIDCIPPTSDVMRKDSAKILDTYCWIHTTFSVPNGWNKEVGVEVPYPGLDKYTPDQERVHHTYYQWVCFVLGFQAFLFYVPRFFWKSAEGGRTKGLLLGLQSPILAEDKRNENRALLVDYIHRNLNCHGILFWMYAIAEVLNMLNVFLQMFIMDRFLGGEFTSYGWDVINFTEWDPSVRYDPMIKVFPRLTKCTFRTYGSSGDVQKYDAICVLPINILNEKIYIILWFWFYFMAIISLIAVIYRVLTIIVTRMRWLSIKMQGRFVNDNALTSVINRCSISDWFLLDLLSKNLDSLNFKDLILDLDKRLEGEN